MTDGDKGTDNDYDVAIIGYGPVGVTAANLLGASGLNVLAVERAPSVYDRARAISTDEEIIRIWQRAGLSERLKADMLSEKPIDFVDADGRSFLDLAPRERGNNHPPQLFIYQPAVEHVLRAGVERFPNVTVWLGRECVRQQQDADGVELSVLDPSTDKVTRTRASYVIAADGGSSPTRGQLGIGFEGSTYEDRWVVIDTLVKREWPEVDRLRFHCNPERPAVDCPTPLGHHRWEFPVLAGDDERELITEPAIHCLLANQGIEPDQVEILRAVIYSHHVRFAAKWRAGRIFLAGDAAHVMPPWIGQGMASGVRDVANLCWKLAAVIDGELPDNVLDSYEQERQPHVRDTTKAAVNIGRIITERNRALTTLRDPLIRGLMRTPGVGTFIRSGKWLPVSRYPNGFMAGRRSRRLPKSAGAEGWQIPQPWVLGADGVRARLDDAVAPGWVVYRKAGSMPDNETRAWSDLGVPVLDVLPPGATATSGAVVDIEGAFGTWLERRKVHGLAVRPDGFVYSASSSQGTLAPPPLLSAARVRTHPAEMPLDTVV